MLPTNTDLKTLVLPRATPIQHFKIAGMFEDEYCALPEEFKPFYEYDEENRQYTLNELEWLRWRKHGPYHRHPDDARYIKHTLGGSDIAALFDGSALSKSLHLYDGQHGSNYKCKMELYYEKIEKKLPLVEKKDTDLFWCGHNEEPSIRSIFKKRYCDDHPLDIVKVINDCHMYQCGIRDKYGALLYPYVLCDLDGLVQINGITGILECKTCNKNSEDYKLWVKKIVPLKYYLQICWYMLCMNMPYAYICAKWGLSLSESCYIYVERDFAVEKLLLDVAKDFIDCVDKHIPPEPDGQNIDRLFVCWRRKMGNHKSDEPPVKLDRQYRHIVSTLSSINNGLKTYSCLSDDLRKQRNDILAKDIFPVLGDASEAIVDYSATSNVRIRVKDKSEHSRMTVDAENLKKSAPNLYQRYVKPVFDAKLFLREMANNPDAAEFIIEDSTLTESKMNYCDIRLEPKLKPQLYSEISK